MKKVNVRFAFIILIVLFIVVGFAEIALGPVSISVSKILLECWRYMHGIHDTNSIVIGAIRFPRLLVAGLVGAGLASSGAVLQAIFRNPMADPAIIGVSSGGSLGAVIMISLGIASF